VVGPAAVVISTDWTRQRTLQVIQSSPAQEASLYETAEVTFADKLTVHLDPYTAEVYFPGKAHTSGDALVYFPSQRAIAMGDLFLNTSSPAMDAGSAENWIHALDEALARPLDAVVPGHFDLATKKELQRFRDYLNDLFAQVEALFEKGATLEEIRRGIHMEKYNDFRQYPQYHATFADNAETIYQQLQQH
jgi:glyoxylase-like metal-dependent hydrolase (beta-lactamase superfamily II)